MTTTLYELTGPWKGRLAIAPRPRGSDWLREDMQNLRTAGVDTLVSTLTKSEAAELELDSEQAIAIESGVMYVSFPIEDRGLPASTPHFSALIEQIKSELNQGSTVAIHCRSAIGRSSVIAAAVLTAAGLTTDEAFARIQQARGLVVPDTPEQRAWVEQFARQMATRTERAAS